MTSTGLDRIPQNARIHGTVLQILCRLVGSGCGNDRDLADESLLPFDLSVSVEAIIAAWSSAPDSPSCGFRSGLHVAHVFYADKLFGVE